MRGKGDTACDMFGFRRIRKDSAGFAERALRGEEMSYQFRIHRVVRGEAVAVSSRVYVRGQIIFIPLL